MPVKSETVERDGMRFTITQLPGWKSWKLSMRLGKIFGPAMAELGGMLPGGKAPKAGNALANLDVAALGKAVTAFFDRASLEESESILRELFSYVGFHNENNIPVPVLDRFDDTMGGKPDMIYWLVGEAIRVNYTSFLGMLQAAGASVAGSKPTTETTGQPSMTPTAAK